MAKRVVTIKGMAREMRLYGDKIIPEIGVQVRAIVGERLFVNSVKLSPVGHPTGTKAKGKRAARRADPHPGKHAASYSIAAGSPRFKNLPDKPAYGRPGAEEAAPVLQKTSLKLSIWIANDAKSGKSLKSYAGILFKGRHKRRDGAWAGSTQAPKGTINEEARKLLRKAPEIVRDAIVRGLKMHGR